MCHTFENSDLPWLTINKDKPINPLWDLSQNFPGGQSVFQQGKGFSLEHF